jgi:FtsP/CotA-like multicopper oxidase with cupredoxin domain
VPLLHTDGVTPILLPDGTPAFGADRPRYMGPLIAATKNRPVRVLFRNLLPSGGGGNLFLPVDASVPGSGMGPDLGGMAEPDPQNPFCGSFPKPAGCFAENRATIHLHGGITPWISDGTPHQWITPAGEDTAYPEGVSVRNVPDMPDPGPGAMTFFYTNQQSARLMFYHDHAWGITRLNVYAGEAAPYVITDPTEQSLVDQGLIPPDQIPLVIQDKTFVPGLEQLSAQDPTWDLARWGGEGNLWMPHVYMPAQNPGDSSGVNQFGRWAYGPWFWPPTTNTAHGPIPNPYFDPACDSQVQWCEPPEIPGTPNVSFAMESFHDTPVVNGTAYPTITIDPKSYRLRIVNAANDRFWNLQLYVADATGTEVALNAAEVAAALADPAGVFPTPDTALSPPGPSWVQIGTEGGFLPSPVVIPPQPITWVTDPTVFNAGNVDKHSLLLGPAERADVIVDFSGYAGRTLILYNDAPAAFPARDPRYDYYSGNADLTETGGAPSTLPGYGPNTRTIMQIVVANVTPDPAFDVTSLEVAFRSTTLGGQGVFESSQKPVIVGQAAYNSAYGSTFRSSAPRDGLVRITDFSFTFNTLLGQGAGQTLTFPLQPKAIQDEMGEAFDPDYGRMSGNLGLETPGAQAGAQNLILYPFVNPASEIIRGIELPPGELEATPIATTTDGTQLWKITHNGVDTHPIHFHLADVQLVNRVGWDGIIRRPDANELGWKETVRISPLEDTILAIRPIVPKQPFGLPDSLRPLNPMMPLGSTAMFRNVDANGDPITPPITNEVVNFGWEYVWHCHILSHEEMDMMRPISLLVSRQLPAPPVVTSTPGSVILTWTDGTPVDYLDPTTWGSPAGETGYRIERASVGSTIGAYSTIATPLANQTTFTDAGAVTGASYAYRVFAVNAAGSSAAVVPTLVGPPRPIPAAPTSLSATLQAGPQVRLAWQDNATTELLFVIERANGTGAFTPIATAPARANRGSVTFTDTTVLPGQTFRYRVAALTVGGSSAYALSATVTVPPVPAAPSALTGALGGQRRVDLSWSDNSTGEDGFTVQRATDAAFTTGLASRTLGANEVSFSWGGLARGTTYWFRVRAFSSVSGPSAWSNVVSVTTQ